jgi:HK97 family phage major capsid protein
MKNKQILKSLRFLLIASVLMIGVYHFNPSTFTQDTLVSLAFVLPAMVASSGKTSKELRESRKLVKDQIEKLTKLADDEGRAFTEDETKELRALMDEEAKFNEQIELRLALEKRQATNASSSGIPNIDPEKREMGKFSLSKFVKETRGSDTSKVTGIEKELIDESEREAREQNITSQGIYLSPKVLDAVYTRMVEKRTMVAGTNSAGGFFIPTEKLGFFDALYAMTFLDKTDAIRLTGLSANTDLPGFSVAVTSGWAAETGTQSPADATVVNRSLRPKLLYSACNVSKQLLVQTNNSIDDYIMVSMMQSMAREFEKQVINGDGSNKPTGILGTSGIQDVAGGTNGLALSYANVLKLVQVVESANANIANAKFLINPKIKAAARALPIDSGSGAMLLSYQSYFGGVDGIIDGYQVISTSNVPSTLTKGSSTTCSAMIFGDFSQLVTAQFGGVDLMVDNVSAAIVRSGQIAITINQFVDSALKQPGAIGAIQDVLA